MNIVARPMMSIPRLVSDRPSFAEQLTRWSIWTLLLAGVVREALGQTFLVSFDFYSLHIVDGPVVLTFAACFAHRAQRMPAWRLFTLPVLVIAALIMVNFVRGLGVDTAAALLWARGNLETAALLMLALYADLNSRVLTTFRNAIVTVAVMLAVLLMMRLYAGPQLFMTIAYTDVSMINDGGRPVAVQSAFYLAIAAAILWSELFRFGSLGRPLTMALAFLLPLAELLSGQGTATIAIIAMLGLVFLFESGSLRSLRAPIGTVLLAVIAALIAVSGTIENPVNLDGAGNWNLERRQGTFDGRQRIWAELTRVWPVAPLENQIFGYPAGQKPVLIIQFPKYTVNWTLSIHSMYYGALPLIGYVGLAAYAVLLFMLTIGSFLTIRRSSLLGTVPAYPLAYCVGTAILSISYEIRNETLIGLFVAMWWLRVAARPAEEDEADTTGDPDVATPSADRSASLVGATIGSSR